MLDCELWLGRTLSKAIVHIPDHMSCQKERYQILTLVLAGLCSRADKGASRLVASLGQ